MNRSIWLSMLDAILIGSAFAGLIALHEHGPISEQEKFLLMLLVPNGGGINVKLLCNPGNKRSMI